MPKATAPTRFRVRGSDADHIVILAEKLAELAILRVPGLSVLSSPTSKPSALFDFVATSDEGVCFFVDIESYSSFGLNIEADAIPVLELEVEAERVRASRRCSAPVVLFLFDGDRGHGRFLRLDTEPLPPDGARAVVLSFPLENAITGDSIRGLVADLARSRAVPASA